MKVKGFIPLGGYTHKASKSIYEKSEMDFGKITGETIVDKENFTATGANGNITFINYSILNFINLIGDSIYETERKLNSINLLIKKFPNLKLYEENDISDINIVSAFRLNKTGLEIYSFEDFISPNTSQIQESNIQNYYFSEAELKEIRDIYNTAVESIRKAINITFFLKDSTGNIFGQSQVFKKNNIFNKPINENIEFKINDTTSSTKDGFNVNEVINLSFKESFGVKTTEYTVSYNSSNLQAVADAVYEISSITYNDNKVYNEITNIF